MTADQVVQRQGDDPGWMVEHRLQAVMEVRAGAPVAEVAVRYGASRQSIYNWRARFEQDGVAGLRDQSRRPQTSPQRMPVELGV